MQGNHESFFHEVCWYLENQCKSDEERKEFIDELLENYCKWCGEITCTRRCYCARDE